MSLKSPQSEAPSSELEEQWQIVQAVVLSPGFSRSARLSSFLMYVCSRSREGRAHELNERQIGIDVFGRGLAYNPGEDSIVRSHARILRGRLNEYFSREGLFAPWRITIPKGSYVPVFERNIESLPSLQDLEAGPFATQLEDVPSTVPIDEPQNPELFVAQVSPPGTYLWKVVLLCLATCLATAIVTFLVLQHPFRPRPQAQTFADQLWNCMLPDGQRTILVAADSVLPLVQEQRRTNLPMRLPDYIAHRYENHSSATTNGSMPAKLSEQGNMSERQFTSIADLNMAVRVAQLPQSGSGKLSIRYARTLTLDDAKEANLILLGGVRANPWVQLFSERLNFTLSNDVRNAVISKHPAKGEPEIYHLPGGEETTGTTQAYGLIAFVPGLGGQGKALLVEGTSMAGTEGACDFLFDPVALRSFFTHIGVKQGQKLPYFEVLLLSTSVGGNAPEASVVAYRTSGR